jgi:uncharacterized protein YjbI with pentapeptide repeats
MKEIKLEEHKHGLSDVEMVGEQIKDKMIKLVSSKVQNCQFEGCLIGFTNVKIVDCTFRNCTFIDLHTTNFRESTFNDCTIHLFGNGVVAEQRNTRFYEVSFDCVDLKNIFFSAVPFNLNNYNKEKENGKSQIRDPEKRYEFLEESLQQGHF